MWKYFILYFYLVTLSRGNDNAETYQERNKVCCEQGVAYARKYHANYQDCWFIIPEKPETLLCKLNKQHCCLNESVKMACSYGIRIAMDKNQCNSTKFHAEQFCKECIKGKAAGSRGESCEVPMQSRGNSVMFEKMLTDTFNQCCKKTAEAEHKRTESQTTEQNKHESTSRKPSESDIGDCANGTHVCAANQSCLETNGSSECRCKLGFELDSTTRACVDIDECATGEATCANEETNGDSTDICINTRGGYRCHRIICPTGYKLESGHRCTRVRNICPPGEWECAHQPITYSYNYIAMVSKLYMPDSKVDLLKMKGPAQPNTEIRFSLRQIDVHAPPSVKDRANINSFLVNQKGNQAVLSLVHSLEGPQTVELELHMEVYNKEQLSRLSSTAVTKLALFISKYEF